jgi:hypothetical protein
MKTPEFRVYTRKYPNRRCRDSLRTIDDVNNFVDTERGVKMMIGYDNIVFGEATPGYGTDGVVRSDIEKWHKENPDAEYAKVSQPVYE